MPKISGKLTQRVRLAALMGHVRVAPYTAQTADGPHYLVGSVDVTELILWLIHKRYLKCTGWSLNAMQYASGSRPTPDEAAERGWGRP